MNREDIIRMAQSAGIGIGNSILLPAPDGEVEALERFAALISAAEREACATICDVEADEFGGMSDGFYAAKNSAEAIRARGCL